MNKNKFRSIWLIIVLILITGNSNFKISFEEFIKNHEWKNRILLLIAKNKNDKIVQETINFFEIHNCKNEERNLKLIKIIDHQIKKFNLPKKYQNTYGIWLIGYDGKEKSYSKNTALLNIIHKKIDEMPIRKEEMLSSKSQCN